MNAELKKHSINEHAVAEQYRVNQLPKYTVRRRDVDCPDHLAMQIVDTSPHSGGFISCEDFDEYMEMMQAGLTDKARELLVAPPGTAQRLGAEAVKRKRTGN